MVKDLSSGTTRYAWKPQTCVADCLNDRYGGGEHVW